MSRASHRLLAAAPILACILACADSGASEGVLVVNEVGELPDAPVSQAEGSGTAPQVRSLTRDFAPAATEVAPGTGESTAVVEPAPPEPPELELAPATSLALGTSGGVLETGRYRISVPGLDEAVEASLAPRDVDAILAPRPLSVPLAVADLQPFFTIARSNMEITLPLSAAAEPGQRVQLLAFSRSMDAFLVVGIARVAEDGTATFHTDLFSQYVVIAEPEVVEGTCAGPPARNGQRFPGPDELETVGRVEQEERLDHETALRTLTDLRYVHGSADIVFKNEEANGPEGAHRPYASEDFHVDPRLVAPLIDLGQAVLAHWRDPIGGGPAIQLRVTDAFDSQLEHSSTSNHYRGLAADLTLSPVPAASPEARGEYYGWLTRLAACSGFDFSHFENRFHVHASSRPARIAFIEEADAGPSVITSRIDGTQRLDVSDHVGLDLTGHDVLALAFSDEGTGLTVFSTNKGETAVYSVDLVARTWHLEGAPSELPRRTRVVDIDPSLTLDGSEGPLVLRRPGTAEGTGSDFEPLTLTINGARGYAPAFWTAPAAPPRPAVAEGNEP